MNPLTQSTRSLIASASLLLAAPSFAGGATSSKLVSQKPTATVTLPSEAERYSHRCQSHAPSRAYHPQGTMLWGTKQAWELQPESDEHRSVLVSVDITSPLESDAPVKALRLEGARLVASPDASTSLMGTVLRGTSSDGKPMEVALCGAEPAPEDPSMIWYRIEAWNPVAQEWENPCVATGHVPDPRALAVRGVWDASGAHHDVPGRFTLACENGVITKCIGWGYKPWASLNGHSLAPLHQACTRMARADYCGNGQSHTHLGTLIDMYDRLGVLLPTTESSADWDPTRSSFEAAWTPDGAACLTHTRDGRAMETILQECPGRFIASAARALGEGSRCTVQRKGVSVDTALLSNRSYGGAASPPQGR